MSVAAGVAGGAVGSAVGVAAREGAGVLLAAATSAVVDDWVGTPVVIWARVVGDAVSAGELASLCMNDGKRNCQIKNAASPSTTTPLSSAASHSPTGRRRLGGGLGVGAGTGSGVGARNSLVFA